MRHRHGALRGAVPLAAVVALLMTMGSPHAQAPGLTTGQGVGQLSPPPTDPSQRQGLAGIDDDPYLQVKDYWNRGSDRATFEMIRNVERYHMDDANFWNPYRKGDFGYARAGLHFVLKYVPNHPTALYLMGVISRQMNDSGYPIPFFERAIRLFPMHAYTRAQYGAYLASIGQPEAGLIELRDALQADSTCTAAKAWLYTITKQQSTTKPRSSSNVHP